jgi:hypothetical protein
MLSRVRLGEYDEKEMGTPLPIQNPDNCITSFCGIMSSWKERISNGVIKVHCDMLQMSRNKQSTALMGIEPQMENVLNFNK